METFFQSLIVFVYTLMSSIAAYANGNVYENHERFESDDVIVTLGVLTLISMISTFLMGYFMPKNRKLLFIWHKRAAIATLMLGVSHAMTVLFFD
jgi:hypothetical protein